MLKKFENIWDREFGEVEFRMLKRIGKCGLCVSIMMGLTMIFLVGCSREKKIDYQITGEDIEGISTDSDSRKSSVSQFADETVWNESWTIFGENDEAIIDVSVEAEICLPETDEMSVVEVMVPQFDAAWKEFIVKRVFGDEDVYYNDWEHLPKRELEKLYAEYEARSDSTGISKIAKLMETAGDIYTPAETYEPDEYLGKIDGITYALSFSYKTGQMTNSFILCPADNEEVCPEKYNGYTHYMKHPYANAKKYNAIGENDCELSEAQAEQMARSLLEELGLEYPVLTEVSPLLWGDDTMDLINCNDWPVNGYVFKYEYGMDGISFPGFENSSVVIGVGQYLYLYKSPYTMSGYSKDASAYVYVTDRGILELSFYNPVETTHISENVKLLPLSAIQEIMKEQIHEIYCDDSNPRSIEDSTKLIFNRMELIYFRVTAAQNSEYYSYIPVWRLGEYSVDPSGVIDREKIWNPVLINAIDGSPVAWNE